MIKALNTIFTDPFKEIKIEDLIEAALEKNEEQILDYNRQQLDRGVDSKGQSLGKYKNFAYKNRYEPVDLKLKNDFRGKFTLSRSKGKKQDEIFSQDSKQDMLVKRYGEDIEGLSYQNMENTRQLIIPALQDGYKKALQK